VERYRTINTSHGNTRSPTLAVTSKFGRRARRRSWWAKRGCMKYHLGSSPSPNKDRWLNCT